MSIGTAERRLRNMVDRCKFDKVSSRVYEANFDLRDEGDEITHTSELLTVTRKDIGSASKDSYSIRHALNRCSYNEEDIVTLLKYAEMKWNGKGVVVALGSSSHIGGRPVVPAISGDGNKRELGLVYACHVHFFLEETQFLVSKK